MKKAQPKHRGILAWGIVLPIVWALLTTFVEARRIGMLSTLLTNIGNWLIAPLCVAVGLYYLMDFGQSDTKAEPAPTPRPAAPVTSTALTPEPEPTTAPAAREVPAQPTRRKPVLADPTEVTPPKRVNASLMSYFETDTSESATPTAQTTESTPTRASRRAEAQAPAAASVPDVNVPTGMADDDPDTSPIDKAIAIKFGFSEGSQQEVDDALDTARRRGDSRMSRKEHQD